MDFCIWFSVYAEFFQEAVYFHSGRELAPDAAAGSQQPGSLLRVAADGVHPRKWTKKRMPLRSFPVVHPHALEIREEAQLPDAQGNRFDRAIHPKLFPKVSPFEEMFQERLFGLCIHGFSPIK